MAKHNFKVGDTVYFGEKSEEAFEGIVVYIGATPPNLGPEIKFAEVVIKNTRKLVMLPFIHLYASKEEFENS